ncbi:MAG TPA: PEGA domain-containing protein [Gemmatimonadales bacterium]|nr:PEGA domain-containing protein [Gemmatimonadales bacterium]
MRCPHCRLANIDDHTGRCARCGFAPGAGGADEASPAWPSELDARRELAPDFRLSTLLAQSASGFVYLARDKADRPVVLKTVARAACGPAADEGLRSAGEATAELDHPHIIPLCGWGATPSFLWYSGQHVAGRSLLQVLESDGRLEVGVCHRLIRELASALDHAHRQGVSHGDLTAAHVIIDPVGDAFVADFAIAGFFAGGDPSPAADQRALAALAYECLTGIAPPPDAAPRRPSDLRPDTPPYFSEAVQRALHPQPAARFPTVRDFAAAAIGAPAGVAIPPPRPSPGGSALPLVIMDFEPPRRRLAPRIALAALGLVLAAVGVRLGISSAHVARPRIALPPAPLPVHTPDTLARVPAVPVPAPAPALATTAPPPPAQPKAAHARRRPTPRPAVRRSERPAVAVEPGRLSINATPWGVVSIDGRVVGNTPLLDLAVAPGLHRMRVQRAGFKAVERVIPVTAGQGVRITDVVLESLAP